MTDEQVRPPLSPTFRVGTWRARHLSDLAVIRRGLARTGPPAVPQRLVLVASELVTNALRHGAPPVVLTAYRVDGGWLLDVADGRPDFRRAAEAGRAAVGYGLAVVGRVSRSWGWYRTGRGGGAGKHVWAWLEE